MVTRVKHVKRRRTKIAWLSVAVVAPAIAAGCHFGEIAGAGAPCDEARPCRTFYKCVAGACQEEPYEDASAVDGVALDSSADETHAPDSEGGVVPPEAGSDAPGEPPSAPLSVAAHAIEIVATVTMLAGSGDDNMADGQGTAAMFDGPRGLAVDADGNVYVADWKNHRVRKITPKGYTSTLSGSGSGERTEIGAFADGTGPSASFWSPSSIAVSTDGNLIVGDSGNNRIRNVTMLDGTATTLAGTSGTTIFNYPLGVAVDAAGNIYVADSKNHRIRKVTPLGAVTTLAGSGTASFVDATGTAAGFNEPDGVVVDASGNVYVADTNNHRIRKVTPAGKVTTLAGSGRAFSGDGTGSGACFNMPQGLAIDAVGNIYVGDMVNELVRRVTPEGKVTTVAGDKVPAEGPKTLGNPWGVAVTPDGIVYVSEWARSAVRKVSTVGIGQIAVSWSAPGKTGSSAITSYTASASLAGFPTRTCTTTGALTCTIRNLKSDVAYDVSVTATNAAGTSGPSASSASSRATPN